MDRIRLEIGYELIPFITGENEEDNIISLIGKVRKKIAEESELSMPQVHIVDNTALPARGFKIYILEEPVREGNLNEEDDVYLLSDLLKDSFLKYQKEIIKKIKA